jgi:hypothetical protein
MVRNKKTARMAAGGRPPTKLKPAPTQPPTFEERRLAGGETFGQDTDTGRLLPCERAFIVADLTCHKLFGYPLNPPEWFTAKFKKYPAYHPNIWEFAVIHEAPWLAVENLFTHWCVDKLTWELHSLQLVSEEKVVKAMIQSFVAEYHETDIDEYSAQDWEDLKKESEF